MGTSRLDRFVPRPRTPVLGARGGEAGACNRFPTCKICEGLTGGCDVRIAVMAAGAVGGYFGGRMAAAGHDVAFIARGAHGDAIRRNGLRIESALGDLHLKNLNVTDDPKQVGPVELVLFAVKLWDTETAGEQTRPLVGSNTRVITLQNGVDSVERLAPILGDDATIGGATYVVA